MSTGLEAPDSANPVARPNFGYLLTKVIGKDRMPKTYLQFAGRITVAAFATLPWIKGDVGWVVIVMLFGALWTPPIVGLVEYWFERHKKAS